jgi:hypothetical protein
VLPLLGSNDQSINRERDDGQPEQSDIARDDEHNEHDGHHDKADLGQRHESTVLRDDS